METPFRALSFKRGQVITDDDMEQLIANYQWVFDNHPRARYYRDPGKPTADTLAMVLGGRARIAKSKKEDTALVKVNFRKAFSPGCQPHVTTGVVSDLPRQIFCVVNGPAGKTYPNSSGFEIKVVLHEGGAKDKIARSFFVDWIAYGYREANYVDF